MKTVLRRSGPLRLFGGRIKTKFTGILKGILRGSPPEIVDDSCLRVLEDGFIRLLEDGEYRLLEECPDETGNTLDATLDFTL